MIKSNYYKITGLVLGNLWGGGEGAYPSEQYEGNSLKILMKEIKRDLKNGALDSGMGFESLIGALLEIEIIENLQYMGKTYHCSSYSIEFIGDLTEKQKMFLEDNYMC